MSAVVKSIGSRLKRVIVVRQVDRLRWSVVGYERQESRWQFTWLLCAATSKSHARQQADDLARETGLPIAEFPLGERMSLLSSDGRGGA